MRQKPPISYKISFASPYNANSALTSIFGMHSFKARPRKDGGIALNYLVG